MKDTNSFLPHPILSFMLVIIWLLLNNTVAAGHIVLGIVLAILIPWFTSSFWQRRVYIGSFFTLFKFVIIVAYDIIVANLTVARQVMDSNDKLKPKFFNLPLDIKHPLAISTLASTISLTPGTVWRIIVKSVALFFNSSIAAAPISKRAKVVSQIPILISSP